MKDNEGKIMDLILKIQSILLYAIGIILFIALLVIVVYEILILRIFNDVDYDGITADLIINMVSLVLAIILGAYSMLYSKKVLKSPIIVEARTKHSFELLEISRKWHQQLSKNDNILKMWNRVPEKRIFHAPPEVQHIIDHHVKKPQKDLLKTISVFSEKEFEFNMKVYDLQEKILDEFVTNMISISGEENSAIAIPKGGLFKYVYIRILKYSGFEIDNQDEAVITPKSNDKPLNVQIGVYGFPFPYICDSSVESFEVTLRNLLLNEEYLNRYISDGNEIVSLHKEVNEIFTKIDDDFKKIHWYPILPGDECESLQI